MEGEGGGVKYQCVVSSSARPTGDLARNPGCALTGKQTGDALVCRPALNPLSCTSPGKFMDSYFSSSSSSFIYLFIYFRVDQYSSLYLYSLLSFNIHILKIKNMISFALGHVFQRDWKQENILCIVSHVHIFQHENVTYHLVLLPFSLKAILSIFRSVGFVWQKDVFWGYLCFYFIYHFRHVFLVLYTPSFLASWQWTFK